MDMGLGLKTKVGLVGAVSFLPILVCVTFSVIHLNGDIEWFPHHLGVRFPWILFPLAVGLFMLSVIEGVYYRMSDTGSWTKTKRNGALIAGVGLIVFLITFSVELIDQLLGAQIPGTPLHKWEFEITNWVLFFGFFLGMFMSIFGSTLFLSEAVQGQRKTIKSNKSAKINV